MKELTVFEHNHVDVVDSRQVAEMIGKTHAHLMRDIQGYVEILKKSIESKFGFNDFFIESTYKDSIGRTLPCYLLTKKGCDMVANKMTGEKGVLFTAAKIAADAEAEANSKIAQSITPELIQWQEAQARMEHGWVTVQGADTVVTNP